jgi:hypothetical protein
MGIEQRDIIELPFYLPQGIQHHPALVLSCNEVIEMEEAFVAALITSQEIDDEYSFPLFDDMLTRPMNAPYREVRLHLISLFRKKDVIRNSQPRTKVKERYFEIIVRQIVQTTFKIRL